jgi:hypothetical protein
MEQIRISSTATALPVDGRRFVCEWMEASQMNRWFLKARLADAIASCEPGSHWLETRPLVPICPPRAD